MIGRLLGHTQIGTTQRYAHLIDAPLRAGVNAVGEMLKPRLRVVGDAMPKLKGLAKYAEEHHTHFRRIEAVSKTKTGAFRMLDLTKASVRAEVLAASSAEGLYASSVATDYAQ